MVCCAWHVHSQTSLWEAWSVSLPSQRMGMREMWADSCSQNTTHLAGGVLEDQAAEVRPCVYKIAAAAARGVAEVLEERR